MSPKRPCIERLPGRVGCPNYASPGKARCPEHDREHERTRVGPSKKVTQGTRWRSLRARLIRDQRRRDGTWLCGICGRAITDGLIEVDHIVPVAVDPDRAYDESNLRLAHRSCNRSRKRVRGPRPGSAEWRAAKGLAPG